MRNRMLDLAEMIAVGCAPCLPFYLCYSGLRIVRKTFRDRRAEALAELEQAKQRLASLEDTATARIGRLAVKAGLAELEISDVQLLGEFDAIASRFRAKGTISGAPRPPATGES